MDIMRIPGHTRILGLDQIYKPLPVRDGFLDDGTPAMFTAWMPTAEELEAMNAGHPVILAILGRSWPPVMLDVAANKDGS